MPTFTTSPKFLRLTVDESVKLRCHFCAFGERCSNYRSHILNNESLFFQIPPDAVTVQDVKAAIKADLRIVGEFNIYLDGCFVEPSMDVKVFDFLRCLISVLRITQKPKGDLTPPPPSPQNESVNGLDSPPLSTPSSGFGSGRDDMDVSMPGVSCGSGGGEKRQNSGANSPIVADLMSPSSSLRSNDVNNAAFTPVSDLSDFEGRGDISDDGNMLVDESFGENFSPGDSPMLLSTGSSAFQESQLRTPSPKISQSIPATDGVRTPFWKKLEVLNDESAPRGSFIKFNYPVPEGSLNYCGQGVVVIDVERCTETSVIGEITEGAALLYDEAPTSFEIKKIQNPMILIWY